MIPATMEPIKPINPDGTGMDPKRRRNIVIVGGGIIGCTTAYYLTRHPKFNPALHSITVVDAAGIASGASGKAGGLLGLWAYPSEIVPLSYRLHEELALEHGGETRWGFRCLTECGRITVNLGDEKGPAPPKARTGRARTASSATDPSPPKSKRIKRPRPQKQVVLDEIEVKGEAEAEAEAEEEPIPKAKGELDHQPEPEPEPEPVPIAILKGTTTGCSTNWKPITRYSNGEIVWGERAPKPVEQAVPNGEPPINQNGNGLGIHNSGSENGASTNGSRNTGSGGESLTNGSDASSTVNTGCSSPNPNGQKPDGLTVRLAVDERVSAWKKLPKQDVTAGAVFTDSTLPRDLDWVLGSAVSMYEQMGEPGKRATAQVHPYQFTRAMADLAQQRGVLFRLGAKVTNIKRTRTGVESVSFLDRATNMTVTIDNVTDVVVAAGPWTGSLLPRSKIEPVRVHSVVWEADVTPFAVFTAITLPPQYVPAHRAKMGQKAKHSGSVDPEVYARPFGEVYACGETDEMVPLPETVDLVETDEGQCDDLVAYLSLVSPVLASAPVKSKQACYVPLRDPGPVFGPTSTPGLWIASGHSCWGIQNGPATGLLMAEMMLDGIISSMSGSDYAIFDPRRYKI